MGNFRLDAVGAVCDELYYNTGFALSDLDGAWIGPLGKGAMALAGTWDLRQYSSVHMMLRVPPLVGGTSPSVDARLWGYPQASQAAPTLGNHVSCAQLLAGGGEGALLIAGEGLSVYSGGGASNLYRMVISNRVLFGQMTVQAMGSPDSMTGPLTLALYGVR